MPAAARSARAYDRGCYGCYGPMETPNTVVAVEKLAELGATERDIHRLFRTFNADAEPFRREAERHGS